MPSPFPHRRSRLSVRTTEPIDHLVRCLDLLRRMSIEVMALNLGHRCHESGVSEFSVEMAAIEDDAAATIAARASGLKGVHFAECVGDARDDADAEKDAAHCFQPFARMPAVQKADRWSN